MRRAENVDPSRPARIQDPGFGLSVTWPAGEIQGPFYFLVCDSFRFVSFRQQIDVKCLGLTLMETDRVTDGWVRHGGHARRETCASCKPPRPAPATR